MSSFVDPDFPHTTKSLFGSFAPPKINHVASWKRPSEFVKGKKLALFKDGASAGDVKQGALGDCWFLGALSCVGTRDDLIGPLFAEADVEKGKYVCRFWKEGEWRLVTVDDYLPCAAKGLPAFAQSADLSELWPMIAEKAYAKLHGSYLAIESGSVGEGLVDLTGGALEEIDLSTKEGRDKLWPRLMRFVEENWLMGCGFSSDDNKEEDLGIIPNHAYGILQAVEVEGHRLLQLRNPWGRKEWTGDWSDNSTLWTPQLKKKLNVEDANDGVFWMCEKDFLIHYNRFYGVRLYEDKFGKQWQHVSLQGRLSGKSAGGCVHHNTWIYNPQYKISVPNPDTDLYICLTQPDIRKQNAKSGEKNEYTIKIGFCIFNTEDASLKKSGEMNNAQMVLKTVYKNVRTNTADIKLLPGKDYILMPSTFEPNIEMDYSLDVYADEQISLERIPEPEEMEIQGEWSGVTAGGCINHPTWKNNPQYYFFVKQDSKVSLTLFQEFDQKSDEATYITVFLYQADTAGNPRRLLKHTKDIWRTNLTNSKQVGGIVELKKSDKAYIAVPSTKDPGFERRFTLHLQGEVTNFTGFKSCLEWNEVKVSSIWQGISAGGCKNHPTWRNNPMFTLTNTTKSEVLVTLTLTIGKERQGAGVGIYIFPKAGKTRRLETSNDEIKAPFVVNQTAVSFKCSPENGPYMIVATTFEPGVNAPFTLSAFSEVNLQLQPISESINRIASVNGSWKGASAGGGVKNSSWINNPLFLIEIDTDEKKVDDGEVEVNFLLACTKRPTASTSLGLIVLRPNTADTPNGVARNIAAKAEPAMNDSLLFYTKVKSGQWLMPYTVEPGVEADFSIFVYSSVKIKLTKTQRNPAPAKAAAH